MGLIYKIYLSEENGGLTADVSKEIYDEMVRWEWKQIAAKNSAGEFFLAECSGRFPIIEIGTESCYTKFLPKSFKRTLCILGNDRALADHVGMRWAE